MCGGWEFPNYVLQVKGSSDCGFSCMDAYLTQSTLERIPLYGCGAVYSFGIRPNPLPFIIRVRMALKRPIGSTDLKSFSGFDTQPRIFQPPSASKPQNRHRKQHQKHLKPRLRKLATEPFLLDGTAGEVKLAVYKNVFVELVQLPLGQSRWHLSDSSKQPSTG